MRGITALMSGIVHKSGSEAAQPQEADSSAFHVLCFACSAQQYKTVPLWYKIVWP